MKFEGGSTLSEQPHQSSKKSAASLKVTISIELDGHKTCQFTLSLLKAHLVESS